MFFYRGLTFIRVMEIKKQKIQDKLFLFVMDLLFTKYERANVCAGEREQINRDGEAEDPGQGGHPH